MSNSSSPLFYVPCITCKNIKKLIELCEQVDASSESEEGLLGLHMINVHGFNR